MDYLHIDSLRFQGKHGAYTPERSVEQEFEISVRLGVEIQEACTSDVLEETVDYQLVKDKIQEVIEGESRYLIEKLAEDMASKILEDTRIRTIELTLKKNAVWSNGIPGVTITRRNI
jgi:7,8-dihydroneopterin aldolase/epimerase/oxygenase